jgi:tripartite-type tricarboxylate transporter receptor subunit TctC
MMMRRTLLGMAASVLAAPAVWAQEYPTRPIRMIVSFPPGGPADSFGRIFAAELSTRLGQAVVVENRGGAGGVVGADAVAKSAPDGYTIGVTNGTPLTISPFVMRQMPFDPLRDLTLVAMLVQVPQLLVVSPRLGVSTLPALVEHAKHNPGKLNYASGGAGSLAHLAMELLKAEAGIGMVHVPYNGGAPAVTSVLANDTQITSLDLPVLAPQIRAGALQPVAVATASRSPAMPEVPTTAELGYPRVLAESLYAVIAPAGLPESVGDALVRAAAAAQASPALRAQFQRLDAVPSQMTPVQIRQLLLAEQEKWAPVVRRLNLTND